MTDLRKPIARDVALAHQLAAGGWKPTAIARVLNNDGVQVTRHAVHLWLSPTANDRSRARKQRQRAAKVGPRRLTGPSRLARLQTLHEAGLDLEALAIVSEIEFDAPMTADERQRLAGNHPVICDQPTTTVGSDVLNRMIELRQAGLFYSSIALVIGLDYGIELTPEQARYYVRAEREPTLLVRRSGLAA